MIFLTYYLIFFFITPIYRRNILCCSLVPLLCMDEESTKVQLPSRGQPHSVSWLSEYQNFSLDRQWWAAGAPPVRGVLAGRRFVPRRGPAHALHDCCRRRKALISASFLGHGVVTERCIGCGREVKEMIPHFKCSTGGKWRRRPSFLWISRDFMLYRRF